MLSKFYQSSGTEKSRQIRQKAQVFSNLYHFLAFGFGSGLSPVAPGTMGTLAAIPVYLLMEQFLSAWLYITVLVFFAVWGIFICQKVSDDLQIHDFSGIVWDEIVGFLITMLLVPATWLNILWGFLLFRFFDVLKPWPIRWLDKNIRGGLGIMLDDVLAGVFAALSLWLLQYVVYS